MSTLVVSSWAFFCADSPLAGVLVGTCSPVGCLRPGFGSPRADFFCAAVLLVLDKLLYRGMIFEKVCPIFVLKLLVLLADAEPSGLAPDLPAALLGSNGPLLMPGILE